MVKKYFIKLVLSVLKSLFPCKKDESLVLFGTISGKFVDNSRYFYLYLMEKQSRYRPIWITGNKATFFEMHSKGYPVVYRWSYKAFRLSMKSSFMVFTHQYEDVYPIKGKYTIRINLWHGSPLKKIGFDSDVDNKKIKRREKLHLSIPIQDQDYVIVANEMFLDVFESSMKIDRSKILPLGFPRVDYLYETCSDEKKMEIIRTDFCKKSGLNNYKFILFAPTFRDEEYLTKSLHNQIDIFIDIFLRELGGKNIVLLLRLHPYDSYVLKTNDKLICDVSTFDNVENLLLISSMLITDYSSLMFDYSTLNRPVLLFVNDLDVYKNLRGGFYFDIEKNLPFKISTTVDYLIEDIKSCFMEEEVRYELPYISKHDSSESIFRFLMDMGPTV